MQSSVSMGLSRKLPPEPLNLLADAFHQFEAQYGPLSNISNHGKARLAKQLRHQARQKFNFDMGAAYGISLLSMYIESQAVPGDQARRVQKGTQDILQAALQLEKDAG